MIIAIHPISPQPRLVSQAVEAFGKGCVVIYPTDTAYAIGCKLGNKQGVDRIRNLRMLDAKHDMTLLCADLSQIATYARVGNAAYRLLKSHTPGAYTFVLKATKEVPNKLMHPAKKTIGIRVPNNPIMQAVLHTLNEPILTSTLVLPHEDYPMADPYEINEVLGNQVDLVIDGGYGSVEETSIISLVDDSLEVLRHGAGAIDFT